MRDYRWADPVWLRIVFNTFPADYTPWLPGVLDHADTARSHGRSTHERSKT